jgi:hypothetical protein
VAGGRGGVWKGASAATRTAGVTGKYKKESIDIESLATQAHFQARDAPLTPQQRLPLDSPRSMLSDFARQEAQRERIRVAEREGKPEHTYLGANEWAAQPREWTVECDLG